MKTTCCYFAGVFLIIAFLLPGKSSAQQDIEALIDQLVEIKPPSFPVHPRFGFLPYQQTDNIWGYSEDKNFRELTLVMKKIVESGADAVPHLIKHLDDDRKVNLPAFDSDVVFEHQYDFNESTTEKIPEGVNLGRFRTKRLPSDHHQITVGDLCFEALGAIVNRYWYVEGISVSSTRWISSPTQSKELRQAVIDEWGKLDRQSHRIKLIEDFQKPDWPARASGAYQNLCYYYPDEVESLVLKVLNRPIPNDEVVRELLHNLSGIENPAKRKTVLDQMLARFGDHYREAIEQELFKSIASIKSKEKYGNKLEDQEILARKILHETFGWPETVTYEHWSRKPKLVFNERDTIQFVKCLTHDNSTAIGNRVKQIMESERFSSNRDMIEACLTCLAARKEFGEYLAGVLEPVDFRYATTYDFRIEYLKAIANSKSPVVMEKIAHIAAIAEDRDVFFAAAYAVPKESWEPVLVRAKQLLRELPADTEDGGGLLRMVLHKARDNAETVLTEFLKPDTPDRYDSVCDVLRQEPDLAQKFLLPHLEDHRKMSSGKFSVSDTVAWTLAQQIDSTGYQSSWPESEREEAIRKIKEHFRDK